VGVVTSGAFGHRTQQRLALAYLRPHVEPSGDFTVEIIGERCSAQALSKPPYDSENLILRGAARPPRGAAMR
jgi:dimethylglycine dehydrogenase